MPDRDWVTLAGLYIVTGILWALQNSRSGFSHFVYRRMKAQHMLFWHGVGFLIAVFLWPLGLVGFALFSKTGRTKPSKGDRP